MTGSPPPPDELLERVRRLWEATAGADTGGNFRDSGGDSLMAIRLLGAIRGEFGLALARADLDAAANSADLAAVISSGLEQLAPSPEPGGDRR